MATEDTEEHRGDPRRRFGVLGVFGGYPSPASGGETRRGSRSHRKKWPPKTPKTPKNTEAILGVVSVSSWVLTDFDAGSVVVLLVDLHVVEERPPGVVGLSREDRDLGDHVRLADRALLRVEVGRDVHGRGGEGHPLVRRLVAEVVLEVLPLHVVQQAELDAALLLEPDRELDPHVGPGAELLDLALGRLGDQAPV